MAIGLHDDGTFFCRTHRTLSAHNSSSNSSSSSSRLASTTCTRASDEKSTRRARAKRRSRHRSGATDRQGRLNLRHRTASGFWQLLEEVTAALGEQELALRPKTLSWGTLGVTICVPAARGQRSAINKGDPSTVRTPGFCQVREEMVLLTVAQKVRDDIL